ncbi:uncharacterized protein PV07_07560 [Cladophialophora immunda]|uniref:Nephrocystin 3-like N-terminal domain-containing protein n=1 Tax=Cladophialophora immunda TaxID=569365 RepID=A0A0D2CW19_9EURO|nr:uncharacterized protein PV07_07560 [Cladophialophora immunda]KIW27859.1 hypothetical protein PV07_07560 [Cladophialophora immunda]
MIESRVSNFHDTYRWIFYPPPRTDSFQQHEFLDWLRDGTGIFWVSGKPGSGKSSLVDYIYQNLQPGEDGFNHLTAWSQPKHVRLLSFWFFRPASVALLKSLEGLWRSFCFQILDAEEGLAETIRNDEDGLAPKSLRSCLGKAGSSTPDWTDTELKSWFTYLLTHSQYNYCILIDGLDEVARMSDREALLDAVHHIRCIGTKVKLCCSSRPEQPFRRALCQYPSLRLQDLNYEDIQLHCHDRLKGTRAADYADTIAQQAQGVFLWASLVATDLWTGANEGDSEDDLRQRLRQCPAEMDDLFTLLLERQDRFYAKDPKPYLRLINTAISDGCDINLLDLLLASSDQEKLMSNFPSNLLPCCLAISNLATVDLKANVVARCACLVEYYDSTDVVGKFSESFSYESLVKSYRTGVRFIHRSAQDFLLENDRGAELVNACRISEREARQRLLLAWPTTILQLTIGCGCRFLVNTPIVRARAARTNDPSLQFMATRKRIQAEATEPPPQFSE